MKDMIQTQKLPELSVIVWSFVCLYVKFVAFDIYMKQ